MTNVGAERTAVGARSVTWRADRAGGRSRSHRDPCGGRSSARGPGRSRRPTRRRWPRPTPSRSVSGFAGVRRREASSPEIDGALVECHLEAGAVEVLVELDGRRSGRRSAVRCGPGRGARSTSAAREERRRADRARLVEVLVPVPALRRLHARRAAVVARARGDEIERRADVARRRRTRARRCPRRPGSRRRRRSSARRSAGAAPSRRRRRPSGRRS